MGQKLYKSKYKVTGTDVFALIIPTQLIFLMVFIIFDPDRHKENNAAAAYFFVLSFTIVVGFWLYYRLYWQAVAVDNENIYVGRQKIPFNNIADIVVNGSKEPDLSMMIMTAKEVITIKLKNGREVILWLDRISNYAPLRLVCAHILEKVKSEQYSITEVPEHKSVVLRGLEQNDVEGEKFSGNPFLQFNTWLVAAMLVGVSYIALKAWIKDGIWIAIPLSGIIDLYGIYYLATLRSFLVTDKFLFVKNRYYPRLNVAIPFSEMISCRVEKAGSGRSIAPAALIVVSKAQEILKYNSNLLSEKNFARLNDIINEKITNGKVSNPETLIN